VARSRRHPCGVGTAAPLPIRLTPRVPSGEASAPRYRSPASAASVWGERPIPVRYHLQASPQARGPGKSLRGALGLVRVKAGGHLTCPTDVGASGPRRGLSATEPRDRRAAHAGDEDRERAPYVPTRRRTARGCARPRRGRAVARSKSAGRKFASCVSCSRSARTVIQAGHERIATARAVSRAVVSRGRLARPLARSRTS
jgi:hypothetical protein